MPERQVGEPGDVLALLDRAADATRPPTAFDVGPALVAGRARLRRRRMASAGAAAVLAVAAVVAVVTPGTGDDDAAPAPPAQESATPTPSPTPSHPAPSSLKNWLRGLLADEDAGVYGWVDADGTERAVATTMHDCESGKGCRRAVLLTGDGWRTTTVRTMGHDLERPWTALLPDGSAAVVDRSSRTSFVLHLDGTISPFRVSTRPATGGADRLLVSPPPVGNHDVRHGPELPSVWVVDPGEASVAPLATQPSGWTWIDRGVITTDGSHAYVGVAKTAPYTDQVVTTVDGGLTWHVAELPPFDDYSAFTAGPGDRLAVLNGAEHESQSSDAPPLRALWTSDDGGQTWQRIYLDTAPADSVFMVYAPDGTLLMTDPVNRTLLRLSTDGRRLERVAGAPDLAWVRAGPGVLVGAGADRTLWTSADGHRWRAADPATSTLVASTEDLS